MKKCFLLVPFFLIIFFNNYYAQDFGEIPEELLKMTSLAEDPEEDAAVIFDKSSIKITRDFTLEIKRHVRIKVFTEEGKKQANIELLLWYEDEIDDIEAISISPDGKEFELDSDNIFTEEGERTNKVSFPIPGVEVGSVFDYSFSVRSEYISNLEPWSFQNDIYTKYSEVKVYLPRGFAYQRLSMNLEHFELQENIEEIMDIGMTPTRRYLCTLGRAATYPELKKNLTQIILTITLLKCDSFLLHLRMNMLVCNLQKPGMMLRNESLNFTMI